MRAREPRIRIRAHEALALSGAHKATGLSGARAQLHMEADAVAPLCNHRAPKDVEKTPFQLGIRSQTIKRQKRIPAKRLITKTSEIY